MSVMIIRNQIMVKDALTSFQHRNNFFSFYLITSQRDKPHLFLVLGKKIKVMILLCIKKLFCIIYYLSAEALRALEFHPCM